MQLRKPRFGRLFICSWFIRATLVIVMLVGINASTPSLQAKPLPTAPVVSAAGDSYIIIDTAKNQLTLYVQGVPLGTYQVALGKPATPTPIGEWVVTDKQQGWGSGFGTRWIRISVPWGIYGIHGTNKPHLIGGDVSGGCVRMRNQDVERLYREVQVGSPVLILGHPLRHLRRLELGNIGSDVWLVQDRLRRLGYDVGEIDGRYGFDTERAVKRFERDHRLPVNGVVDQADYTQLGLTE